VRTFIFPATTERERQHTVKNLSVDPLEALYHKIIEMEKIKIIVCTRKSLKCMIIMKLKLWNYFTEIF